MYICIYSNTVNEASQPSPSGNFSSIYCSGKGVSSLLSHLLMKFPKPSSFLPLPPKGTRMSIQMGKSFICQGCRGQRLCQKPLQCFIKALITPSMCWLFDSGHPFTLLPRPSPPSALQPCTCTPRLPMAGGKKMQN